jgi:hypothetical protein
MLSKPDRGSGHSTSPHPACTRSGCTASLLDEDGWPLRDRIARLLGATVSCFISEDAQFKIVRAQLMPGEVSL